MQYEWVRAASLSRRSFADNIIQLQKLGEGGYGTVFKGRDKQNNQLVALKRIRIGRAEGVPPTAIREVYLLNKLRHINVVRLFNVFFTCSFVILVFEHCDHDLRSYMEIHGHDGILNATTIHSLMYQLMRAVQYCHDSKIVHRDVKPENILVNHGGELKLGDFGLARGLRVPVTVLCDKVVTLWYRPPELLLGAPFHDTAVDMWSCGCVFAEMITGEPLFHGRNETDQLYKVLAVVGTPDVHTVIYLAPNTKYYCLPTYPRAKFRDVLPMASTYAIDLIDTLLRFDPSTRPSATQVLRHTYFILPYYVAPTDTSHVISKHERE